MPETKQKKAQEPIVKHDAEAHKGNQTASRPDLISAEPDKALEEVRERRVKNELRAATHNRVTVDRSVPLANGGELRVVAADGQVYLSSSKEAVLDKDGAINLAHAVQAAFQAVS
jgi:hypothetical protein